ncbi:MAG: cation:proton antiporter [Endomicrobiaceae bacterium]|jgi:Kef-type K+ transport system membrane component KefB|nr:cation:proton antiporter [Endomicrobiaceae bacterium]MDD4166149.1 cation:proton antiporter [Endomicrobiaceae bacterium]
MNYYLIIICLALFVILSYVYTIIAARHKIPSVLLLILTGIITKASLEFLGISFTPSQMYLNLFGTIGLILIVLEGSVDLSLDRESLPIIVRSFLVATVLLLFSSFSITFLISYFLKVSFINAFLYSIPLSIISSAIVIPGVEGLDKNKKDFMVCESIFSDIIGIILFNIAVMSAGNSSGLAGHIVLSSIFTVIISFLISFLLVYALVKIKSGVKLFPIIAVLILVYSVGKIMHLSTLIIIFVFGLTLRNIFNFMKDEWQQKINISYEDYGQVFSEFKLLVRESSFVIRTFFFIIFGYTLMIENLLNTTVLFIGTAILFITYALRYFNLRFISRQNLMPELLIAPRGLITILLYYSIPESNKIGYYGEGIIVFAVITTGLLMMFGLIVNKDKKIEIIETTY